MSSAFTERKIVFLSASALVLAACSEAVPTVQLTPPSRPVATTYSSSSAISFAYPDVTMSIDTLSGVVKSTNTLNGMSVYSALDAVQAASFTQALQNVAEGDLWVGATAVLNPTENAPPGWQPEVRMASASENGNARRSDVSVEKLIELAKTNGRLEIDGLDPKKYIVKVKSLKLTKENPISADASRESAYLGAPLLNGVQVGTLSNAVGYPQYEDCVAISTAIAAQRLSQLNSKSWVSDIAKGIISGSAFNLISSSGLSWGLASTFVGAFVGSGMALSDASAQSIMTGVKVGMYNMANCQQPISITVSSTTRISIGGGDGSWTKCETVYVTYQVSVDGGAHWSDIVIPTRTCTKREVYEQ